MKFFLDLYGEKTLWRYETSKLFPEYFTIKGVPPSTESGMQIRQRFSKIFITLYIVSVNVKHDALKFYLISIQIFKENPLLDKCIQYFKLFNQIKIFDT